LGDGEREEEADDDFLAAAGEREEAPTFRFFLPDREDDQLDADEEPESDPD
jgi:hypothetical protein